ncbi:MAG: cytochrome b/b6 domain-containing protein [Reinekea sp.]
MTTSNQYTKVWDPLVRIFHWALVIAFATAYLTAEEFDFIHEPAGYTIFGLVVFRLIWGIIGTRFARFSQFVHHPGKIISHLKQMKAGKAPHYLGHNPAAGAMVIALLLFLIGTTVAGMSLLATEGEGPLASTFIAGFDKHTVKEIHEFFANGMLGLIGLHIAGVIFSSKLEKENLARAMLTGKKKHRVDAIDLK